jgi:integrase
MKHRRKKYQNGSITKRQRKTGPPVWEFSYRDLSQPNPRQTIIYSTVEYPTRRDVMNEVQPILLKVNGCKTYRMREKPTFGVLVERFINSEKLSEIAEQGVGQTSPTELKYSTTISYLSNLKRHVLPRWRAEVIADVSPAALAEWIEGLHTVPQVIGKASRPLSAKSKGHIKALMHRLYEKAMLWGLLDLQRNPMELVEVRGISKRMKKPKILTVEQYHALSSRLPEPYRSMLMVAICLGLRVNEVLALQWGDFDFEVGTVHVERGVVHGRVSKVKTEYSEDDLPIDPLFAARLMEWREIAPKSEAGWVFLNPSTSWLYHADTIQQNHLRPAGKAVGLTWSVGWHSLRHTHRSLLDATGAPIGVQQKLMRHASVQTTMNVYGNAYMDSKREANSNVVGRILNQKQESRSTLD